MDSSLCRSATRSHAGGIKWPTITRYIPQVSMKRSHPHLRVWRIKTLERLILKSGWFLCSILIPRWVNASRRRGIGKLLRPDLVYDDVCIQDFLYKKIGTSTIKTITPPNM